MLLERVPNLLLVVHYFLLLILKEAALIHPKQEGRGKVLAVQIELGKGLLRREGVSLELGTELHLYIIFAGVRSKSLQAEDMVLAVMLAPPFSLPLIQLHSRLNIHYKGPKTYLNIDLQLIYSKHCLSHQVLWQCSDVAVLLPFSAIPEVEELSDPPSVAFKILS